MGLRNGFVLSPQLLFATSLPLLLFCLLNDWSALGIVIRGIIHLRGFVTGELSSLVGIDKLFCTL